MYGDERLEARLQSRLIDVEERRRLIDDQSMEAQVESTEEILASNCLSLARVVRDRISVLYAERDKKVRLAGKIGRFLTGHNPPISIDRSLNRDGPPDIFGNAQYAWHLKTPPILEYSDQTRDNLTYGWIFGLKQRLNTSGHLNVNRENWAKSNLEIHRAVKDSQTDEFVSELRYLINPDSEIIYTKPKAPYYQLAKPNDVVSAVILLEDALPLLK